MRLPSISASPDLSRLWPLAVARRPGSQAMAGKSLRAWQESAWAAMDGGDCWQREDAWISPADIAAMVAGGPGTVLMDATGTTLAGWATHGPGRALAAGIESFLLIHPWDFLRLNEFLLKNFQSPAIHGQVSPAANIEGTLILGEGSRVLPGVFIEGTVVIGRDCKIGPNCYLRGSTSIGDRCHIGQSVEIKNCLIGDRTNVGHLSYIGDSVLGDGVNLGAGTTTSNLRHDGQTHRSMVAGSMVDTGRRKFGSIFGDGVHTGIHTSVYPGRKFGPGATTLPGEIVRRDLPGRA